MGITECIPTSIDNYFRNFKHVLNQNYLLYSKILKLLNKKYYIPLRNYAVHSQICNYVYVQISSRNTSN